MQTYTFTLVTYMHATLSLWIKTRPIDLEIDEVIIDTLLSGQAERKCLLNSRINSMKYEHPTFRISIWLGAYLNHLKWRTLWSTPRYLHPQYIALCTCIYFDPLETSWNQFGSECFSSFYLPLERWYKEYIYRLGRETHNRLWYFILLVATFMPLLLLLPIHVF